jgi:hypothetical protein
LDHEPTSAVVCEFDQFLYRAPLSVVAGLVVEVGSSAVATHSLPVYRT